MYISIDILSIQFAAKIKVLLESMCGHLSCMFIDTLSGT